MKIWLNLNQKLLKVEYKTQSSAKSKSNPAIKDLVGVQESNINNNNIQYSREICILGLFKEIEDEDEECNISSFGVYVCC